MEENNKNNKDSSLFDGINPLLEDATNTHQNPLETPSPVVVKDDSILETILQTTTPETSVSKERDIKKLDDIILTLIERAYDFARIDPKEKEVEIVFIKDSKEAEKKSVSFAIYSSILLQSKTLWELDLSVNNKVQEGKWHLKIEAKTYNIQIKTQWGDFWEIAFIKAKIQEQKVKKKISIGQLLSFFWATSFVAFVLWWAFISFVVINAKTIDDVKFFYSLWISLNDINTFISQLILIIFWILLFIESFVLIICLYKFILAKKFEKRKRIVFWFLSTLLLTITFSTASAWMYVDDKVKNLPNWQEVAYGDVQIFDNDKLISDKFEKAGALLRDTTNLIGPITLKYDLSLFKQNEEKRGFKINKYIWDFGDGPIEELSPTIIKKLEDKGTYNVSLIVEETDLTGKVIEKKVDDVTSISITHIVKMEETILKNGGRQLEFDASDLGDIGKVEWYFEENLEVPAWTGSVFRPQKVFYEEELIGMYIRREDKVDESFDKVFVIGGETLSSISGKIDYTQSIENELSYTFKVSDITNDFWDGFIEEFIWVFWDKEERVKADVLDLEKSSEVKHDFAAYGKHDVKVILKDSGGNVKELTRTVNIIKNLKLKEGIKVSDTNNNPIDIRYEEKSNEYFINDLWIPTILKFDARNIKSDNFNYSLEEIYWDIGNDGKDDGKWKLFDYTIDKEGNYTLLIKYAFQNRKVATEKIILEQKVYIQAVKKEAIIDFKIEKSSNYAPITVKFDASLSQVKGDNIIKFIYDYGDGIIDERWEAIVSGHLYGKAGEYQIKLTVITEKWKQYSTQKKLVLSPKPQIAEIGVSMKSAPVWQGIDFSSDKSEGQIVSYFWNFGDGNTTTEANPTYAYKKAGTYTVTLKIGYGNNNFQEDTLEIVITD